jgi:hypothetical protein
LSENDDRKEFLAMPTTIQLVEMEEYAEHELCPVCLYLESPDTLKKAKANLMMKALVISALNVAIITVSVLVLFLVYPFKGVTLVEPVEVLNPNKTVQLGESVKLAIQYRKYTNSPSVIIRTLYNLDQGKVVDSMTLVSHRKAGRNTLEVEYPIPISPHALGRCEIRFSVMSVVMGARTTTNTFRSEPFTVGPNGYTFPCKKGD